MHPDHLTRDDLAAALRTSEVEVADFFRSLTPDELVIRVGNAWTAAEQLAHLNTVVSAVARGFAAPRLLLRIRYGRSSRSRRTHPALRDEYRAILTRGGRATGPFVPARNDLSPEEIGAHRGNLLARWGRVNGRLQKALEPWTEKQLDTIQLPHPLLGKLSGREMIYFTVYHSEHHVAATKRRLPRFAPG